MWWSRVLHTKRYGEHRILSVNDGGESIENSEYLLEFYARSKFVSLPWLYNAAWPDLKPEF
jgi:hypothetical protein